MIPEKKSPIAVHRTGTWDMVGRKRRQIYYWSEMAPVPLFEKVDVRRELTQETVLMRIEKAE
jgi:hypothetical protein